MLREVNFVLVHVESTVTDDSDTEPAKQSKCLNLTK